MILFFINLAFANPNEETPTQTTSTETTPVDSEFDFLSEKKEQKTEKKNIEIDFDDSEFIIDASLMHSNDKVLVPQADDSFLLPEKSNKSATNSLPEDTILMGADIALEEKEEKEKTTSTVDVNSTDNYDALMGDLE